MKYTVKFVNRTTKAPKVHTVIEMDRYRLTRNDFRIIIAELFFWAAQNCDFRHMEARVYRDDAYSFSVRCITKQDGSEIASTISVARPRENYETVRVMTVAA